MPASERPVAALTDFPGLVTNVDPRDLPAGAAEEQINLCSMVQGEMRVRLGIREVIFEGD